MNEWTNIRLWGLVSVKKKNKKQEKELRSDKGAGFESWEGSLVFCCSADIATAKEWALWVSDEKMLKTEQTANFLPEMV